MNETIKEITAFEQEVLDRFTEILRPDQREGYAGLLVGSLRDEFGYDHLTSVTGVDYLEEEKMEVVYHLFKSTGGPILEIKVRCREIIPQFPHYMKYSLARTSRSEKPGICWALNSKATLT